MDERWSLGSDRRTNSEEHVIAYRDLEVPTLESPRYDEEGLAFIFVSPKCLTSKEIEVWQEIVSTLKQKPKMRVPPPALKRKWTVAQSRVWDLMKVA